ncbi:zinc-binding alcohol dehydrogenase family protein [Alteromonas sp. C1M14]|uniref:zinc-binding alcohol dehydrogenase family protein n=1 Tax=Alteromonas sp. C1M14 TaxID=2841567 RepID=UPI001C0A5B8B|nr:zinc-binding alcohol dehydrogenase family protein [Alteromonas sp. C1M14]MBU2979131.1 zinc-binding alcohol dehydrogenase family protein [Alteromonas sp. C1M14]
MRAYGYKQASKTLSETTIQAVNIAKPVPAGRDLLIQVHAVSVNPVDTKIRKTVSPPADEFKVLGWDAVGVVADVGSATSMFKKGDRVFYAGDISRPGSNAEYQLVDERIVGHAPTSLTDEQAAAMPLTSLTAYELLFDRLGVAKGKASEGKVLLITGAAGGVGSVLVQLARQLTSLTIVGTASRPESQAWVKRMGAHHVIDHGGSLSEQFDALGLSGADYIASLTHTNMHFEALANIVKPQGKVGLIDDPGSIDIGLLKRKSVSLHWEFMYTRSLFNTPDMGKQQQILNEISRMLDEGTLISTLGKHLGVVNAENIINAHQLLESNRCIGKLVLAPFEYA